MAVPVHITLMRIGHFLSQRKRGGEGRRSNSQEPVITIQLNGPEYDALLEHLQEGPGKSNALVDVTDNSFKLQDVEVHKV